MLPPVLVWDLMCSVFHQQFKDLHVKLTVDTKLTVGGNDACNRNQTAKVPIPEAKILDTSLLNTHKVVQGSKELKSPVYILVCDGQPTGSWNRLQTTQV